MKTPDLSACWRQSARRLNDVRDFGVTREPSKWRLWPYGRKQLKQFATRFARVAFWLSAACGLTWSPCRVSRPLADVFKGRFKVFVKPNA
jgi:hypothetical protein